MATPVWFDSNAYIVNKAAQMKVDTLGALAAFKNAGWPTDAEGLYSHFVQYGKAEGVSPNSWFDNDQYLYGKAAAFYNTTTAAVTTQQLASMKAAMASIGMSPWDHYNAYWSEGYVAGGKGSFHNPSVQFDANQYMADKLAQVQKTDATFTMDKLVDAFKASGLDPMGHYLAYGKGEGLTVSQVAGGTPGQTFSLTLDVDTVIGTAGNDYISAPILGVTNSLQNGDYIDGGAGQDTLYADLTVQDDVVLSPAIVDVETILFRAQENGSSTGTNHTQARFDAEKVTLTDSKGLLTLGSDNSRADMSIEDVRWNSNQTTIRFSNTDPGDVDLSVYFDPQHLKSESGKTTGTLYVQLIDTVGALPEAQGGHDDPLYDNPYTGFNFTLNGKAYAVSFGKYNHETDETPTYEELAAQIQKAIDSDPNISGLGLKVTEGADFKATVGIGDHKGTEVSGTQIEITTDQGVLAGGNWVAANGLPPTNSTSATFDKGQDSTCPLLVTNVELDNVGRVLWADANPDCLPDDILYGSTAGDLIIGSMANRGGVERLDVTVDRGSWLSSISSTNDALRMITVKGEDIDGNGVVGNGQLYIGDWDGSGTDLGDNADITTWTDAAKLLSFDDESGLKDVAVFDATGYKGDINLAAGITADSFDKYFKSVDGVKYIDKMYAPLADEAYNGAFSYITGDGNDVINMSVNGAIAADVDFKMNITTGNGNDLVAFRYEDMTNNQSLNQKNLGNVTIDTGEGNDTVWFYAPAAADGNGGSVIINTGAGNDVIYANQQEFFTGGNPLLPTTYNAVFVFNTSDPSISIDGLEGATLSNDMAIGMNNFVVTPTAGETLNVTVTFKGHTVTAKLADVTTGLTSLTAEQVNHAIIEAIANDPVLGKLLSAKDGAGHTLIIESLINGEMTLNDLAIAFNSVAANGSAGSTTIGTGSWYNTAFGTDGAPGGAAFDGNDTTNSQVIVDGGAGSDLIVLGSNGTFGDIVKVGTDTGNDTLIGFNSGVDKISLAGILDSTKALDTTVGATTLKANGASFLTTETAADTKAGIFTQAEVNKLIADGKLAFDGTAAENDAAVVLLRSTDAAGNYVYTLVKMVNGTTDTGVVLGSYTLDAKGGTHTEILVGDLTEKLIIRDATGGVHYDAISGYAAAVVGTVNGTADAIAGTMFFDSFKGLTDASMVGSGSTAFYNILGGYGDDAFEITGVLGGTSNPVTLSGENGNDTFNVTAAAAYAIGASGKVTLAGGVGDDHFNLTASSGGQALSLEQFEVSGGEGADTITLSGPGTFTFSGSANTAFNGGDGNDIFNLGGVVTTVATFNGGNGDDVFNIKSSGYDSGSTFVGGSGDDTIKIESTATGALDFASDITEVEHIEYAGNDLLTISGDQYLTSVKVTATSAAHITLNAIASTELTVTLGDYANVQDTIKVDKPIATAPGSLTINNFEAGNGKDIFNVTDLADAKDFEGVVSIANSVNMTDSTATYIAVLNDIAALTKDNFSTSSASATEILVSTGKDYVFIVADAGTSGTGTVYHLDSTGSMTLTMLGVIDLQGTGTIAGFDASNFDVA